MGLEKSNKEDIAISGGYLYLAQGDLSGAFQSFVQDGDLMGLRKLAEEYYRRRRKEDAEKTLEKAAQISESIDI